MKVMGPAVGMLLSKISRESEIGWPFMGSISSTNWNYGVNGIVVKGAWVKLCLCCLKKGLK
ncbi:MAG TPA: hypothetical protein VGE40_06750 [Bacilli bacterium]